MWSTVTSNLTNKFGAQRSQPKPHLFQIGKTPLQQKGWRQKGTAARHARPPTDRNASPGSSIVAALLRTHCCYGPMVGSLRLRYIVYSGLVRRRAQEAFRHYPVMCQWGFTRGGSATCREGSWCGATCPATTTPSAPSTRYPSTLCTRWWNDSASTHASASTRSPTSRRPWICPWSRTLP